MVEIKYGVLPAGDEFVVSASRASRRLGRAASARAARGAEGSHWAPRGHLMGLTEVSYYMVGIPF